MFVTSARRRALVALLDDLADEGTVIYNSQAELEEIADRVLGAVGGPEAPAAPTNPETES